MVDGGRCWSAVTGCWAAIEVSPRVADPWPCRVLALTLWPLVTCWVVSRHVVFWFILSTKGDKHPNMQSRRAKRPAGQTCSPRPISPFRHTPQSVSRMHPIASSDTERDPGSTKRPSYFWQSVIEILLDHSRHDIALRTPTLNHGQTVDGPRRTCNI